MKIIFNILSFFILISCFSEISGQNCQGGNYQKTLNVNNINTLFNTKGNLWWNDSGPRYEFPSGSGKHLLFNGSIWMGGRGEDGTLRLAAQDYGLASNDFDFYPGPIDPQTGTTSDLNCFRWDKIFEASAQDNFIFSLDYSDNGQIDNPIPLSISGWPARGNPLFEGVHGFALPDQPLAPFVDQDGDGIYEPMEGDYPKIKGTTAVWWVYNDIGGNHNQTNGNPLTMEIQVMVYAFGGGNELIKNSTFYEYKLIYYGNEPILDYYTTLWIDPDVGCPNNDFIGCVPEKNLGYAYNGTVFDQDCNFGNSLGYESDIPVVGIKVLKNTTTPDGMMSGFTYYFNNVGFPTPVPGTTDPGEAPEYYNYMQGFWLDGTPQSQGGNGYSTNNAPAYPFAFDNSPINGTPWTECSADIPDGDRRFLMNFGPTTLNPGQIQELNFAAVVQTDAIYPCPEVDGLIEDTDFISEFNSALTEFDSGQNPISPFALFNTQTLNDDEILFTDASFFSPTEWVWDFGDGTTSNSRDIGHTYLSPGTYTVCLTASNSIGTDTYCEDITLDFQAPPIADFNFTIIGLLVGFENLTVNDPDSQLWDFGDGSTATSFNVTHSFPSPAIYEVCLTSTNSLGEDSLCKEVNLLPTSTDDLNALSYTLHPNPVEDYLYLNFTETILPDLEIRVFNASGIRLNPPIQKIGSQFEILVEELPTGLYFFELIGNGKNRGSGKFIVN